MSLINELEDMSLKMSPRFVRNVKSALEIALEEKAPVQLDDVKASLADFIEAVKIMGLDELRTKLEDIARILEAPGPAAQVLLQFRSEFNTLADNVPSDEREFLKKKEPPPFENMDVSIDRDVIDRFTAIPGVGEERARVLYFSGFKSVEDLSTASVARLFGVPGMTLSVAKKIADHFNPNRLVRLETLARDEEPSTKAEISFVGKPQPIRDSEAVAMDEVEPGEDLELIELFIERLTEYLDGASTIIENLSSQSLSSEMILHLEEITHELVKTARYMGFEQIHVVAERLESTIKDIISGDDQLTKDTVFFLKDSLKQIETGCAGLKKGIERLKEKREETAVSLEYNILTMANYWGELSDLYKDTHEILRRVSQQGTFSTEDLERLRENSSRLDDLAGSISELVEDLS